MSNLERPRESTVRRLYALSMNQCAFPDCPTELVTPETGTIIGEVCHIHAHNEGGPRYLDKQTEEERHGFDNLVLMCRNHHKEIDTATNLGVYTVEWLIEAKRNHETRAREVGEIGAPPDVVAALVWTVTVYEAGATHMDFRNAVFKVGGEGGGPAGGGGSGGVLTIVGIASLPADVEREMKIDLAGEAGQYPGAGGGGGGVLVFQGRPATDQDVVDGLSVPLFFPADSISLSAGRLLDVLGAGWEYCGVQDFPWEGRFHVAFAVDFGFIDPNVLLGFEVVLLNESGVECGSGTADVSVPERLGRLNRKCGFASVTSKVVEAAIYELQIRSGGFVFARYRFEIKIDR
ncbi:HNH endonuclease signature motif containing protein [Mycobacterium sp. CPCC 205372]|uniref:HNH endonuclease signature motif containing protein n=1 Tax=Mycobacterium hippophais TaxID=3016340 RepID=A0ABT4PUZ0_9MYCO|nr:HNH endonuclease signature motif containing protein [Mycobacterium hippophais]MCZ8380355.1 HNH endonuclease signature motif containing protein [Mycobacterium hippophais]